MIEEDRTARAGAQALEAEQAMRQLAGPAFIERAIQELADTQAELVRLSGLTENTVRAIKKGKRPTAAQRAAIMWAIFKRWS